MDGAIVDELIATFLENEIDEVAISLFEYHGADPVQILETHADLFREDGNLEHAQVILSVGLIRGFGSSKRLQQLIDKSSKSAATRITEAFGHYSIKFGVADRTDLTIGRMMTILPFQTFGLWIKICDNTRFKKLPSYDSDSLPTMFQYSGAPNVMGSDCWKRFGEAWIDWQHKLSIVWKKEQSKDEIQRFAELGLVSKLCPIAKRVHAEDFE